MPTQLRRKPVKDKPQNDPVEVLKRLERMVRRSDGFTLGFVKCNHPLQQKTMREDFLARLSDLPVLEVELAQPIVSLLDELTARWSSSLSPSVVCVYGLEKSINALQEASPVLGRLNNDRDLLRRAVPVPLLIWLPDFALDLVARGAPDFWAWRSGVYEFPTESLLWQQEGLNSLTLDTFAISSLNINEKKKEIARLNELLRTAHNLRRQNKRETTIVLGLLFQLGLLHSSLSELDYAKKFYEEGLQLSDELSNRTATERFLHELARLQQITGNLDEAKQLYQDSLTIARKVDDKISIAATLHNLGVLSQSQRNFEEASIFYKQSIEIKEALGDTKSIVSDIQQLGLLQHELGELGNAKQLYQQSLKIKEEMGDIAGIAGTLHLLGMLQQSEGNYSEAQNFYERSLSFSEQAGDKFGQALTHAQLGVLEETQGHFYFALQYLIKAWLTFYTLGVPQYDLATKKLQRIQKHIGEEQFNAWIAEDFGPKAQEILTKLHQEPPVISGE